MGAARSTLLRHVAVAVVVGAALFLASYQMSSYRDYEVAELAAYVVAVAGLTLLTGGNGQISLGHGALMAVGGYTTAVLTVKHGWSMWAAWGLALVVTAAAGALVGSAAARLRGPYLAGATLALAVGVPPLALYFSGLLGGESGFAVGTGQPTTSTIPPTQWQEWTTGLAALVALVLLANLSRSRFGRNFRAVRDDEVAAALAGLSVARVQVLAFVVSSAAAGLAGGMFVSVVGQVSPGAFPVTLSLQLLTAIVVGGLGSIAGAVWGSLILVYLPDLTSSNSSASGANVSIMIYGALLALVMIFFPGGVQGGLRRLWHYLRGRLPNGPAGPDRRPAVVVEPLREREETP